MQAAVIAGAVLFIGVGTAAAQTDSRWYAGVSASATRITADEVDGMATMAGGTLGVRLTPVLSVEANLERGLSRYARTYEGTSTSFAPLGSSRAEIEQAAVHRRWHNEWTPTVNLAVVTVWRPAQASRIRPAAYAGVTFARYREEYASEVTALPPVVPVPADHPSVLPERRTVNRSRGGLTAGVMLPIALGGGVSLSPDLRFVYGSMGNERHNLLRAGVRLLWGF